MRLDVGQGTTIDVPPGWELVVEHPAVVMPHRWHGEPPAVVVHREPPGLVGPVLAAELLRAATRRLEDSVVVDLCLDSDRRDVELVVAHRNQGVAVTTLERHYCCERYRWVVAFTATDRDWSDLWRMGTAVVGSLAEPT